jgi:hypothetical protein
MTSAPAIGFDYRPSRWPVRLLAGMTVLALMALAAAALGWWGTGWMQEVRLDSGARYRVVEPGTGPAFASRDAAAVHIRLHVNTIDAPVIRDTAEDEDGAQPVVVTFDQLPPGLRAAAPAFHAGGRYTLWVPAPVYIGGPIPPGAPFSERDTLVLEVRVLQIAAGQAAALEARRAQQMMEQLQREQGGNSAAPAAPPAANSASPAPGR